jgi:hypothetical protein
MRTRTDNDGSTPWMALFVGALIAVVAVIGYLIYNGAASTRPMSVAMNLPAPAAIPQPSPPPAPLPKPAG